jgi:hypothetical protein
MMTLCRKLASCLVAALWTGIASAQVTHVYISSNTSTYAYDVSPTGKLNPIKGSPFTTAGNMVGSNGSYFVSIGPEYVYSNKVAANGAIGEQVSEINTQNYTGVACGTPPAAGRANPKGAFDHTGQNVYAVLYDANNPMCDAIQTFAVDKTGVLTFSGATVYDQGSNNAGVETVPALPGNDNFAYNELSVGGNCNGGLRAFSRESSGTLNNITFTETDPTPPPNTYVGYLTSNLITADTTNHLAILVNPTTLSGLINCFGGSATEVQLASYTVDSQGNVTSTNTYSNMPTLDLTAGIYDMQIDPTGSFLAVAVGKGVKVYHFNGAQPITPFSSVLKTSDYIYRVGWDHNGRLYAQDGVSGEMHVYTVTSTEVEETSGSPTVVPVGQSFTVRSK